MGDCFAYKYIKSYKPRLALLISVLTVFISILLFTSTASAVVDITLEWDASSGPDLAGYRVFSRVEGQAYDFSSPDWEGTATTYTIQNLADNTSYCFVARAFDSLDNESANSNEECYQPAGIIPPAADAGLDQTVDEGSIVQLDGSGSSDPSGDPLTYQWTQTAGTPVVISNPNIVDPTFTAPTGLTHDDVLTFQLVVNDGNQDSSPDSVTVTVQAAQPYGNIASLAIVTASSESTASNQIAVSAIDECIDGWPNDPTCEWATQGEGSGAWIRLAWGSPNTVDRVVLYDRPNSNDQITSATLSFSDGSTLQVGPLNNDGAGVEYTFAPKVITSLLLTVDGVSTSTENIGLSEIEVFGTPYQGDNQFPVADAGSDKTVEEGVAVTLDGSNSSDSDGSIVSYAWNFGDGTNGTGATVNHTYGSPGTYTVTLTVTDDDGATGTDTTQIQVNAPIPVPIPTISFSPTFLGANCNEGSDASSQTFEVWNSGTGTLNYTITDNVGWLSCSPTSAGSTGEHDTITISYDTSGLAAGTYSGTIIITGSNAANSPQTISVSLQVNPLLPTISRSPTFLNNSCTEGTDAPDQTFKVWNSGGGILNYSITDDVGWLSLNPTSGTSNGEQDTITVTYNTFTLASGTYYVTISITDPNGSNTPQTIPVTLYIPQSNLSPNKPVISSPYDGEIECDVLLTVKTEPFSDPDGGDFHNMSRWQIVHENDFLASDFSSPVLDVIHGQNLTELPVPHTVLDRDTTYYVRVQFYDNYSAASVWSDGVQFTTTSDIVDFNADGIPDNREVDSTVDLNSDGIPDIDQPDEIKCVESAVAGHVAIGVDPLSATVESIEAIEPINPSEILDKNNKPKNFVYGLFSYRLRLNQVGATVLVTIYYSEDISGADRYYLYDTINGWEDYTQYATFNPDGYSVTIELKDGGHGDSDGVANGIIVDPGGVTTTAATGGLDSGAGGGCFIATAAFDADPHLKLNASNYIDEHDWLKPIVRVLLMPLVGMSYVLRTSLATIILTGFLLIISMLSFYTLVYRRRRT